MSMASTGVAVQHYGGAQKDFKIPPLTGGNIFLGDVMGSTDSKDENPISCGLFRMTQGEAFTATYKYHETLIILEGSFEVSDSLGNKSTAAPGDIYWFPKGSTVTMSTSDSGLAYYAVQRLKR